MKLNQAFNHPFEPQFSDSQHQLHQFLNFGGRHHGEVEPLLSLASFTFLLQEQMQPISFNLDNYPLSPSSLLAFAHLIISLAI
jgi:hypothetical protein